MQKKNLQLDPYHIKGYRNVCWSLFALRRYEECQKACQDAASKIGQLEALMLCGKVPLLSEDNKNNSLEEHKKERLLLRRVQHASLLCHRLGGDINKMPDDHQDDGDDDEDTTTATVTYRLEKGWYRDHLLEKIASGEIASGGIPATDKPVRQQQEKASMYTTHNDCYIIQAPRRERPMGSYIECRGGEARHIDVADFMAFGFPMDQSTAGMIYQKEKIFDFHCPHCQGLRLCCCCSRGLRDDYPMPTHRFPEWAPTPAICNAFIASPCPKLDAFHSTNLVPSHVHSILCDQLDALRERRKDFPVPKYQNIIDPNIGSVNDCWVPTEFEISQVTRATGDMLFAIEQMAHNATNGQSCLPSGVAYYIASFVGDFGARGTAKICSKIPDLDPHSYAALYSVIGQVFEASIPMLANMRNPSLLLPGPIQAVVKAQRIFVKEGESYEGVWHEDGMNENVVAVVLYYYRSSDCLEGGSMEIASKATTVVWKGDSPNISPDTYLEELPRAKVPIQEGSLLVFSNYAAVHRVLPMMVGRQEKGVGGDNNKGAVVGSRDFLAFFIIDQRSPLPLPKNLGPMSERKKYRMELLQRQLEPRGRFGNEPLYSTGNGTPYDLGWIRDGSRRRGEAHDIDHPLMQFVDRMNLPPLVIDRGVSGPQQCFGSISGIFWKEEECEELNPQSSWKRDIIQHPDGRNRVVWSNVETFEMTVEAPNEGHCETMLFSSTEDWLVYTQENGYFWKDDDLD